MLERGTDNESELTALRNEAGPVVRHVIVVGLLIGGAIGIGLLIQLAQRLFPDHVELFEFIERVDAMLIAAAVCLFAIYMIALLLGRLWKSLLKTWA